MSKHVLKSYLITIASIEQIKKITKKRKIFKNWKPNVFKIYNILDLQRSQQIMALELTDLKL